MYLSAIKRALLALVTASLVFASGAGADDINLPDLGSPADAILSANTEAQIGRPLRPVRSRQFVRVRPNGPASPHS